MRLWNSHQHLRVYDIMSESFVDPLTNEVVQVDPEGGTGLRHESVALLSRYHRFEFRQMTPPIPKGQPRNHDFKVFLPDGENAFFLQQLQQEPECTVIMALDAHVQNKWHVSMKIPGFP